jgi:hypothetical protein
MDNPKKPITAEKAAQARKCEVSGCKKNAGCGKHETSDTKAVSPMTMQFGNFS